MASTAPVGGTGLKKSTIFFYGLMDLPIMMMLTPISVFLHGYYTVDLKLDLSDVANVILASRLLDIVTDPLVGWLSDRTRTRWGRRRVWIVLSLPLLMLGVYMLFMPSGAVTVWYLFFWLCVFWLGWTMILIPYYAWAAELTPDYHERSLVTGWRSMIGTSGQLLANVIPVVALLWFGIGGKAEVLHMMAVAILILLPVLTLLSVWRVPERGDFEPTRMPILAGLKLMMGNKPFLQLVIAFLLNFIALGLTTAMFLYYVEFVVQAERSSVIGLVLFYGCNVLAVSFWVWLSHRIGKHRAWIGSLLLISSVNILYLLHGPGDFYWMLPIMAISGLAAGSFYALPNSMKADVIDMDTLECGEDRAALYFAAWSAVQKLAPSVSAWLALTLLDAVGFQPGLGLTVEQPIWALKLCFSLLPVLFFLASAAVAWNYPITEDVHRKVRDELATRRAAAAE